MGSGGDLSTVFIKRQDGDTRSFTVVTGGDNSRILGGRYTEEVEANGDGKSVRDIIRNRPGEREVVLDVNDANLDHEWIVECSSLPGLATVSYTHLSGIVYTHQAKPTGDIAKNDGNATVTATFKGTALKQDV